MLRSEPNGSWTDSEFLNDDIYATSFGILILSPEKFQQIINKNYSIDNMNFCFGTSGALPPLPLGGNSYQWYPASFLIPSNTVYNPTSTTDTNIVYTGYEYDAQGLPYS